MKRSDIHIGDVLRIREWDDMVEEFGCKYDDVNYIDCERCFTEKMTYLCGQKFTVKEVSSYDGFLSEEGIEVSNDSPVGVWVISADMLEPYEESAAVAEESPDELFAYLLSAEAVR